MDEKYTLLNTGEKIQKFDEYNTDNNLWRVVPDFLIGDKIVESSSTKWRRLITNKVEEKKWYSFIFKRRKL